MTALAGLAIAALLWWALKQFGQGRSDQVVRLAKLAGGVIASGFAALLLLRGRVDMAMLSGGVAAWLFGWSVPPGFWPFPSALRRGGTVSRLRSADVEIELDRDTGAIDGVVLAGSMAGRRFGELGLPELMRIRRACLGRDIEGGHLVEAYLDRRFPAWRENAEGDADLRGRADLQNGPMTQEEAHEILGLQPGAGPDDIRAAHRRLIKKLHPDQGGSTYLASRVNEAKDLLLDRHR